MNSATPTIPFWTKVSGLLERLLDLYLAADFPREVLTYRKSHPEKRISAWE